MRRDRPTDQVEQLNMSAIPGLPGYYINPSGRVFSLVELTPYEDTDGYLRVHVFKNKQHKRPGLHVLIAKTFLPEPESGKNEVRHLDGNKKNITVVNLAWGTTKENGQDKAKHGSSKGSRNGRSRLDEDKVIIIKNLLATGVTCKSIASMFDVSSSTIEAIKEGRNWGWLT